MAGMGGTMANPSRLEARTIQRAMHSELELMVRVVVEL
jgi:hypothetical protein